MKKRFRLFIAAVVFCTLFAVSIPVSAAEPVDYRYPFTYALGTVYYTTGQCTDYETIDSNNTPTDWKKDTWYVVRGEVTISDRVKCDGAVHLILTDGCKLTCALGIQVETATFGTDASLEIYGQSEGKNMGHLIATGDSSRAGIGSGFNLQFYDGDITGTIIIYGGYIDATGGEFGAGIGGGRAANGGNVAVWGGEVHAQGGDYCAGIGGGPEIASGTGGEGGSFTIYGGYVQAAGGNGGAGIGGGKDGDGGDISLYGGYLDVSPGGAVGGDDYTESGFAFGRGANGSSDGSISVGNGLAVFVGYKQINCSFEPKPWEDVLFGLAGIYLGIYPCGDSVTYQAYNPTSDKDEIKSCTYYHYINRDTKNLKDGWYVVNESGAFTEPVIVSGDVHLIIENGKTLTANRGIRLESNSSLTVYGQPEGKEPAGKLIASSNFPFLAGIGCVETAACGDLTIHGCDVIATGSQYAAGIGGCYHGNGGTVTLYGGTLTATAGSGAPRAIGAGYEGSSNHKFVVRKDHMLYNLVTEQIIGSDPYINNWIDLLDGASVSVGLTQQEPIAYRYYKDNTELVNAECRTYKILTANERELKDGCWYIVNEDITFPSGECLTVRGNAHIILCDGCGLNMSYPGDSHAGIYLPKGSALTVYGQQANTGSMTVIGGDNGAGIGGSSAEDGGTLNVHGGAITAYGGSGAAAIGGGYGGDGGEFNIYGGTVVAQNIGDSDGVGIGSGFHAVRYVPNYSTGDYDKVENTTAGKINIYGGTVTATGRGAGPGIGGGNGCNAGEIRIYGGTVTATSGSGCIGGIDNGVSMTDDYRFVRAEGGSVTVSPQDGNDICVMRNNTEIIGSPFGKETEIIDLLTVKDITDISARQVVKISTVHDFSGDYTDNGDGTHSQKCIECNKLSKPVNHTYAKGVCTACGHKCEHIFSGNVCTDCGMKITELKYMNGNTEENIPENIKEITKDTIELSGGWYVVANSIENGNRIIVKGTAGNPTNIILLDGRKLDAKAGIEVAGENALNIYGQKHETGKITATGNGDCAAIGGSNNIGSGAITMNGGTVTATAANGAGIGGGNRGIGGTITINGGAVTATSTYGAGIGGGNAAIGGKFTVNGGNVTATSEIGAGIGGGNNAKGGRVTVNGGTVRATSYFGVAINVSSGSGMISVAKNVSVYDITKGEPGVSIKYPVEIEVKKIKKVYIYTNDALHQLPTNPFVDVPADAWYTEAVLWCNTKGYMIGTGEKMFSPGMNLTRAMFVQMLARVAGADLDTVKYTGAFKDVPADAWYAKAVEWAKAEGITNGTGKTTFSPNAYVTREQLAKFLYAYAEKCGYNVSGRAELDKYTDAATISDWATDAVKWAVINGIIAGTTETTVSPQAMATRAQAAVILMRFVNGFMK